MRPFQPLADEILGQAHEIWALRGSWPTEWRMHPEDILDVRAERLANFGYDGPCRLIEPGWKYRMMLFGIPVVPDERLDRGSIAAQ